MSDNVLQTLQKLVQDVIAPDVRETKVRLSEMDQRLNAKVDSLDHRLSEKIDSLDQRLSEKIDSLDQRLSEKVDSLDHRLSEKIDSLEKRMDANTKMILSELRQLRSDNEITTMRAVAELRERVAVLEVKQAQGRSEAA